MQQPRSTMPTPQEREEALFRAAVELAPDAARRALLDQACAGDSALRQRLEALLSAHDEPDKLIATGVPLAKATMKVEFPEDQPDEAVGQTLGRYKLLERVGEGGCGVVYVAEQTEPVRRRVALKVIKLGMDTKQVVARFEAERQALAMMDHPNIAKVLDAGTTGTACEPERGRSPAAARANEPSSPELLSGAAATGDRSRSGMSAGRPYFVMELVRGIKITEYCDQANLSTKERLGAGAFHPMPQLGDGDGGDFDFLGRVECEPAVQIERALLAADDDKGLQQHQTSLAPHLNAPRRITESLERLVQLYDAWGKPAPGCRVETETGHVSAGRQGD